MSVDQLIKMANQIGRFFEAMPDRDAALLGAAQHLRNFWAPRMRRELLGYLDARAGVRAGAGGADERPDHAADTGLMPFIAEAIAVHRQLLG
ncbi:MAG: formate dehydrogenase subunit delta [Lautropia sp.]